LFQVSDVVLVWEELRLSRDSVLNGGAQSAVHLIGPSTGNAFVESFKPTNVNHFMMGTLRFGTGGAIFPHNSNLRVELDDLTHRLDGAFLAVGTI
jgi:hypothetical protein